jgi:hypothetical protein
MPVHKLAQEVENFARCLEEHDLTALTRFEKLCNTYQQQLSDQGLHIFPRKSLCTIDRTVLANSDRENHKLIRSLGKSRWSLQPHVLIFRCGVAMTKSRRFLRSLGTLSKLVDLFVLLSEINAVVVTDNLV